MQLHASPFIVMILDCEQIGNFIVMNLLPLLVLTVCNYVIYKTVSRWGHGASLYVTLQSIDSVDRYLFKQNLTVFKQNLNGIRRFLSTQFSLYRNIYIIFTF